MPKTTRLLIHGASGRMGQALLRLAAGCHDLQVVAGANRGGQPLAAAPGLPVLAGGHLHLAPDVDAVIDFSLPEAFDEVLAFCLQRGVPLVSGTTGLAPGQREAMARAAARIPLVWSANYSAGVAILGELVRQAAAALPEWDADIVESHHVHKKDAPSGTALALGAAVEAGRGRAPAYASLRAGDIVGEHLVQLTGAGERLELVHRATNRDIFARGALEAARRLPGRAPGEYAFAALLLGRAPG